MVTGSARAKRLKEVTIRPTATVAQALAQMDRAGMGALGVCTADGRLVGLLTDGDIRRAILREVAMEDPCATIANQNPITVRGTVSAAEALYVMSRHDIDHLPVVDGEGVLQDLLLRKDLGAEEDLREGVRKRLESVIIPPETSIAEAIARLNQAGTGALALCTADGKLVGLLTDGDIRRAILRGTPLEQACEIIARLKPVCAHGAISKGNALRMMARRDIDHLPVVDADGHLIALLLRKDLVGEDLEGLSAVVMAGGFGTRLLPLTEQVPKPMLTVGDRPLLERTIQQLRRAGIREVNLTTHYLSQSIVQHFGDGEAFGVKISYSNEDQPLGTAGGLKLMKRPAGPFLVMNGDVLTGVSFEDMLRFHRKNGADMTVGVRKHEVKVPFGVVDTDDIRITQLREKPSLQFFINAGIYLLEPVVCDYIPAGERFDMTDLIRKLLDEGRTVLSFPIIEYWQDVGGHEDYRQAQEDYRDGRV